MAGRGPGVCRVSFGVGGEVSRCLGVGFATVLKQLRLKECLALLLRVEVYVGPQATCAETCRPSLQTHGPVQLTLSAHLIETHRFVVAARRTSSLPTLPMECECLPQTWVKWSFVSSNGTKQGRDLKLQAESLP